MKTKEVRILVGMSIDGVEYKCNDVVNLNADKADALSIEGMVDAAAAAVKYCVKELGAKVIEHEKTEAPPPPAETASGAPAETTKT
jgi:hypothetical protein